jgi:hypothetical protein
MFSVSYQLPITSYQLPSSPIATKLSRKQLAEETELEYGGEKSTGGGIQPFLVESVYFSNKSRVGRALSVLHPPYLKAAKYHNKLLGLGLICGYIYNMKDRPREKDRMIHVRFTEEERRRLKAHCAKRGISMQEYIRLAVLKGLQRKKGGS